MSVDNWFLCITRGVDVGAPWRGLPPFPKPGEGVDPHSCAMVSPIEMLGSQLIGPQPRHASIATGALDVRIAVSGELLDGGVQRVHDPKHSMALEGLFVPCECTLVSEFFAESFWGFPAEA